MTIATDVANMCKYAPNAVAIVAGAQTSTGPITTEDVPESDGAGGTVLVTRTVLRAPAANLSALTVDSQLTAGGTTYRVRDIRREGGGALYAIILTP